MIAQIRTMLVAAVALVSLISAGMAVAAEKVDVRFGDHKGFSRAVFDWPSGVGFRVEESDGAVMVHFDRAAAFDFSNFRERGPRAIASVRSTEDGKTVLFAAKSGEALKAFQAGNRVVIDIAMDKGATSPKKPSRKSAAKPPVKPAATATAKKKPVPTTGPVVESGTVQPQQAATVDSDGGLVVPVLVERRPGRTILRFQWPEETAAAALHRGEHVWLAFEQQARLQLTGTEVADLGPIDGFVTEPTSNGTLVRMDVAAGASLDMVANDGEWIVDIGGGRGRAEQAIEFEVQAGDNIRSRIFAAVGVTSEPVIVDDPVVGDRIVLVPLRQAGLGVRPARRFVHLDLPETQQGVAIRFKSLDLTVNADESGLSIRSRRSLNLAAEATQIIPSARGGRPPELAGFSGGGSTKMLTDFKKWAGEEDITNARHRHLQRISLAKPAARNSERKAYARFLVANGLAAEALGVMGRIEDEDRRADLDPAYRVLRGIARLMTGKYTEASGDLGHSSVEDAADAGLFRGLLFVRRRQFDEALQEMKFGWNVLDKLPPDMQADFRIALAETALEMNDPKLAEQQIEPLLNHTGARDLREDAQLLGAQINDLIGEAEEAELSFAELSESAQRDIRARARFAETNLLLREDRITIPEAIEKMEQLRFAWRGDVFEFDLLKRLGELYIDDHRYREGMIAMRRTIDEFPDLPEAQRLAGAMNDVFARLFEGQHAEVMSPVTAMGLYYDFRELTPEGDRGDRMIRRLADRLAKVELLDEAAKLLEHQVRHRLKGDEKARVGTRLAVLYLLDGKPEGAIKALRSSRNLSMPETLVRERRLLEARGLTEMGRYDRALMLLNGLTGADVSDVRTEILWRARKWRRAAASLSTRLVDIRTGARPLAQDERRDVLRYAIASSLAEDRPALARLKDEFTERMKGQPEWPAFQIVTAEDRRDTAEFRNLASEIAQVDRFESFMTSYRDRLRETPLSAIN